MDGTPEAAALFDEMVEATERWLEKGTREGWVHPSDDPRARAAVADRAGLEAASRHYASVVRRPRRAPSRRWLAGHLVRALTGSAPLMAVAGAAAFQRRDLQTD